jgi:quinol monooxygenase YgiN
MTALPGRREEVIALIRESVRAGGSDTGLLTYSINTVLDDPNRLWVTELWTDKQAHDTTTRSEPVVAVTQRLLQLLTEPPAGAYGYAVHVEGRTSS